MSDSFDLTGAMPFDRDAAEPQRPGVLAVGPFAYEGRGYSAEQFARYVQAYNFGKIPPDQIVLHHTAIPSASWARFSSGAVWDANEAGLSNSQIHTKRIKQLDQLRDYYHDTLGWSAGPHLFIDDRLIWTFTPMAFVGIHAKEGNSYRDANGRLHYSIGIEVIGYYEHVTWPPKVAALVRAACQALSSRLGITLEYQPGPKHDPARHAGSLSSHRDFNKPACPGAAITEAFYVAAVAAQVPTKYRVRPVRVSQRQEGGAPYAGELPAGVEVEIDATYPNGMAHLRSGLGFVKMSDLEAI